MDFCFEKQQCQHVIIPEANSLKFMDDKLQKSGAELEKALDVMVRSQDYYCISSRTEVENFGMTFEATPASYFNTTNGSFAIVDHISFSSFPSIIKIIATNHYSLANSYLYFAALKNCFLSWVFLCCFATACIFHFC